MIRARRLSITPGTAIALVALFFALGGSAFAVGERIQRPLRRPAALRERRGPRDRDRHRHREPGHREHPRQVHERGQPLLAEVQLHRQGRAGAPRRGGSLRGALRRDLRRERGRKRRLRRRLRDRRGTARAARSSSRCIPRAATIAPTSRSRSWRRSSCYGKRGETNAATPPASSRSTPAIARKSHVISLSPGSRPSREPRLSYAFVSASAVRASENSPPVVSAIARSVSGSGGTGMTCARVLPGDAAERPALDHALRGAERDRVDGEAAPPSRAARPRAAGERRASGRRRRGRGSTRGSSPRPLVRLGGLRERSRRSRRRRRGSGSLLGHEVGDLPPEQDRGLESVADRGAAEDEELVDVGDRRLDELVVVRRRRRDLRLSREDDEPDPEVVRRLVEERAKRLLRRAEPRRLDVLRLHRARRVDDEDHRRLLAQERALDVRAGEADDEGAQAERRGSPQARTAARSVPRRRSRGRRGSCSARRSARGGARPRARAPTNAARTSRPSSIHGLWKLTSSPRAQRVHLDDRAYAGELGVAAHADDDALAR